MEGYLTYALHFKGILWFLSFARVFQENNKRNNHFHFKFPSNVEVMKHFPLGISSKSTHGFLENFLNLFVSGCLVCDRCMYVSVKWEELGYWWSLSYSESLIPCVSLSSLITSTFHWELHCILTLEHSEFWAHLPVLNSRNSAQSNSAHESWMANKPTAKFQSPCPCWRIYILMYWTFFKLGFSL